MTRGQKIAFQILFFLYLAGILFLCFWHFESLPDTPSALLGIPMDKLVHCAMFIPFPILAKTSSRWTRPGQASRLQPFSRRHVFLRANRLAWCLL